MAVTDICIMRSVLLKLIEQTTILNKGNFFKRGDKKVKKTIKTVKLMIISWKIQGSGLIFF